MSKEVFIGKIPFLTKSKNAFRESDLMLYQYKIEIDNINGLYSRNELDKIKPFNRLKTAFIFTGETLKVWHCKNLLKFMLLMHYKKEHNETQWDNKINILKAKLVVYEVINPEIKKEMSVASIEADSRW